MMVRVVKIPVSPTQAVLVVVSNPIQHRLLAVIFPLMAFVVVAVVGLAQRGEGGHFRQVSQYKLKMAKRPAQ